MSGGLKPNQTGLTAAALSAMPREDFVAALAGVWEHSPWIAARSWDVRPFPDRAALGAAMEAVVRAAAVDEQLALIRAHPRLVGRSVPAGALTAESEAEQSGAGLHRSTREQAAAMAALNDAYDARFGFPFIIAVRGHTSATILEALRARLGRTPQEEHGTALSEIAAIARARLGDRVA